MRGKFVKGSAALFAGMALAACTAGSFVALDGASVGVPDTPQLEGVYKATVLVPMLGPVHARLTAEPASNGFTANTRPGVAWSMIGGIEGVLGRLFAPFLFPGGVILTWESDVPRFDQPGEGWINAGSFSSARMQTRMISPDQPIELLTREGQRVGLIALEPASADDPPYADYPALADNVEEALQRLYDPSLADSSQVRGYMRHLRRIAGMSSDDVEFIFGAGVAAWRNIKFPWPLVAKKEDPTLRPWDDAEFGTFQIRQDEENGIVWLRVRAFIGAEEVDKAFEEIIAMNPTGLMLDLLNCPGVTLATLRVVSWIATEPVYVGTFFTADHREAGQAGDVAQFPTVHIDSAESVVLAETALDVHGAINVVVHPVDRPFDRPVSAVTTDKTATSAEPMIWALKNHTHARIHGRNTAGHPQLSRPIDLGQDWIIWVATADYRPPTGERMDRGVRPDFPDRNVDRAKAAGVRRILEEAQADPRPRRAADRGR